MVALNLLDTCFIRNTDRGQKIKKGPWAEQKDTSIKGLKKYGTERGKLW